jgi:hypothetical protein
MNGFRKTDPAARKTTPRELAFRSPVTIACRPKPKEIELPDCQRSFRLGNVSVDQPSPQV